MDSFSCEECRALHRALVEAAREVRRHRPEFDTIGLNAWLEGLNEEECARLRATSSLWEPWRKSQEHRVLTGHSITMIAGLLANLS